MDAEWVVLLLNITRVVTRIPSLLCFVPVYGLHVLSVSLLLLCTIQRLPSPGRPWHMMLVLWAGVLHAPPTHCTSGSFSALHCFVYQQAANASAAVVTAETSQPVVVESGPVVYEDALEEEEEEEEEPCVSAIQLMGGNGQFVIMFYLSLIFIFFPLLPASPGGPEPCIA